LNDGDDDDDDDLCDGIRGRLGAKISGIQQQIMGCVSSMVVMMDDNCSHDG